MEHRANLEIIAPTVDEAIQKGLDDLGLDLDKVDIQVLDEGGGGLFGLGGRQARVRLVVKSSGESRLSAPTGPVDTDNLLAITKATVQELLSHMDIRADVAVVMGQKEADDDQDPVLVDITGGDLSILIGRHAETLNALQLVSRLIVGKEVGHMAHIVIDVEGYRKRREEGLRQLAQRMAEQALSTGRRQSLEPMTPAERRIIHLTLRESQDVTTESVGEEPRRKVVIIPRS